MKCFDSLFVIYIDKTPGMEEVSSAASLITGIDESKVLKYLKAYNNKSI